MPFIEAYDFNLRVERKLKSESIISIVALLQKAVRIALHRNLITYPPFYGYKIEKPEFQIRSLSAEEFERLMSTPIELSSQSFIRDLFVFATFTGLSYADLSITMKIYPLIKKLLFIVMEKRAGFVRFFRYVKLSSLSYLFLNHYSIFEKL